MSHCGICGTWINDAFDDWSICADCAGDDWPLTLGEEVRSE